jgi:myo-inositol-1(or 4)-monophosphatase
MEENVDRRAETALGAARAGAAVAESRFRGDLRVERKTHKTDVVTAADRDAQRAVIDAVREAYPEDPVVGEEEGALKAVPDEGATWVVDPIDGTSNFVRGTRTWTTSVVAVLDGEPVAAANVAPALGDTYAADAEGTTRNGESRSVSREADPKAAAVSPGFWWDADDRAAYAASYREAVDRFGDVRHIGSAQLTLSMVATGELDGAFTTLEVTPWDALAGVRMIRAAGGVVTDLGGERWRHDSEGLIASNGDVHDGLLAAAHAVAGGR